MISNQNLGDLDGIEGRAFAQVVGDDGDGTTVETALEWKVDNRYKLWLTRQRPKPKKRKKS